MSNSPAGGRLAPGIGGASIPVGTGRKPSPLMWFCSHSSAGFATVISTLFAASIPLSKVMLLIDDLSKFGIGIPLIVAA
jgi:hypothetical protein